MRERRMIEENITTLPDSRNVEGYAVVFNSESRDLGGFVEVIDLNRIRWCKHIGFEEGCKNFERLNIDREALTIMAESYAKVRHYDPQQCAEYIISHRWYKHVLRGITNL